MKITEIARRYNLDQKKFEDFLYRSTTIKKKSYDELYDSDVSRAVRLYKESNKDNMSITLWLCSFIFGFIIFFAGMNANFMPGVILGLVLFLIGIIWTIVIRIMNKSNLGSAFITECEKNNINGALDTVEKIERAKLIADKYKLKYTDIHQLYFEEYEKANKKRQLKQQTEEAEELDIIKQGERKEAVPYIKYLPYTGREKRIAMLTELIEKRRDEAKRERELLQYMYRQSKSYSTPDPYIAGGAASGAAGGGIIGAGAGIVTGAGAAYNRAAEAAVKSAAYQATIPALSIVMSDSHANTHMANTLEEELERTKTLLLDEKTSDDDLFSHLCVSTSDVCISRSGAFKISAIVEEQTPIFIYESVEAVIDGAIAADLYQNQRLVGTAYLVFPVDGIGNGAKIEGMNIDFKADANLPYTIKYRPYHLWAIEKVSNDSLCRRETISIKKGEEKTNATIIGEGSHKELSKNSDQMHPQKRSRYNYICQKCNREFMAKPASCPFCGADEKDIQQL